MEIAEANLTLEEIAMLADGTGIADQTARKLAPLIVTDPRLAAPLGQLRRMAKAASVDCFFSAVKAHQELELLIAARWRHPAEVLDPEAGICYSELIALASARAEQAAGAEKERLRKIHQRLEQAHAEHRAAEDFFQRIADWLLARDRQDAEALLRRLTEHHRFRRNNPEWKPRKE